MLNRLTKEQRTLRINAPTPLTSNTEIDDFFGTAVLEAEMFRSRLNAYMRAGFGVQGDYFPEESVSLTTPQRDLAQRDGNYFVTIEIDEPIGESDVASGEPTANPRFPEGKPIIVIHGRDFYEKITALPEWEEFEAEVSKTHSIVGTESESENVVAIISPVAFQSTGKLPCIKRLRQGKLE